MLQYRKPFFQWSCSFSCVFRWKASHSSTRHRLGKQMPGGCWVPASAFLSPGSAKSEGGSFLFVVSCAWNIVCISGGITHSTPLSSETWLYGRLNVSPHFFVTLFKGILLLMLICHPLAPRQTLPLAKKGWSVEARQMLQLIFFLSSVSLGVNSLQKLPRVTILALIEMVSKTSFFLEFFEPFRQSLQIQWTIDFTTSNITQTAILSKITVGCMYHGFQKVSHVTVVRASDDGKWRKNMTVTTKVIWRHNNDITHPRPKYVAPKWVFTLLHQDNILQHNKIFTILYKLGHENVI